MAISYIDGDLQNQIDEIGTIATVDSSALTDSWLKSANGGYYRVSGSSRTGTFIADADSNYGILVVEYTPRDSSADKYGTITYTTTGGRCYMRTFVYSGLGVFEWKEELLEVAKGGHGQTVNVTDTLDTPAKLASALANVTFKNGLNFVNFFKTTTSVFLGTMIYHAASNNYGAGIFISYYLDDAKTYEVTCVNRTFTVVDRFKTISDQISYKNLSTATDLNTLTGYSFDRWFYGSNISIMTNKPSAATTATPFSLQVIKLDGYYKQILHILSVNMQTYERTQYYSGGVVWGSWRRTELNETSTWRGLTWKISGVNNMYYLTITGTTTQTIEQYAYFNTGMPANGYERISITGVTENTILPYANGDIKFINTVASGTTLSAVILINTDFAINKTGTFKFAASAGGNEITSSSTLIEGSLPSYGFDKCIFQIISHSSVVNQNTIEVDGASKIYIKATSAQNITVRWFYTGA